MLSCTKNNTEEELEPTARKALRYKQKQKQKILQTQKEKKRRQYS